MVKPSSIFFFHYVLLAILVVFASLGLGYLDHETKTLMDLFNSGNLIAIFIYFLPAYAFCLMFYVKLRSRLKGALLIISSILPGCIFGFLTAGIILFLNLKMWGD